MHTLSVSQLVSLLSGVDHPAAVPVLAMASRRMDEPIPLARQEPRAWSSALELKYSMVRDRGYRVDGLESLVDALAGSEAPHVVGGAIAQGEESCIVVLDEACHHVVGLLHIAPELGAPSA